MVYDLMMAPTMGISLKQLLDMEKFQKVPVNILYPNGFTSLTFFGFKFCRSKLKLLLV